MDLKKYQRIVRQHLDSLTNHQPLSDSIFSTADLDCLQSVNFSQLVKSLNLRDHSILASLSQVEFHLYCLYIFLGLPLANLDEKKAHEDVVILSQYLAKNDRFQHDDLSTEAAVTIRDSIIQAILPRSDFVGNLPYGIDETSTISPHEVAKYHHMSSNGLAILSQLCACYPIPLDANSDNIALLQCAASFTDPGDPWTCDSSKTIALRILDSFRKSRDSVNLSKSLSGLLGEYIKPAFAAGSRNHAITPQGRKAIYEASPIDTSAVAPGECEGNTNPWKYSNVYIITVFQWILQSLDQVDSTFIQQNYPQLTPPLLTLIDDTSTSIKAKGIHLLRLLLPLTPSKHLKQTGLGEVFEQSLLPCLAHLPPLTAEKESLKLLKETYPALIALANAHYSNSSDRALKQKALDRLMREGILAGHAQASEHVKIADFLAKQTAILASEMGIDCVKYLKNLLPLLSTSLSAPFALTYPPLLLSTLDALQMIILIAWPRIPRYRVEILEGLTVCWCRICDEEGEGGVGGGNHGEELESIQQKIRTTVKMLTATLEREDLDVRREYGRIVKEGDERLRELLVV